MNVLEWNIIKRFAQDKNGMLLCKRSVWKKEIDVWPNKTNAILIPYWDETKMEPNSMGFQGIMMQQLLLVENVTKFTPVIVIVVIIECI